VPKPDTSRIEAGKWARTSLSFPSDPRFLSSVREYVKKLSQTAGFDVSTSNSITLAVDEACTNVIKHSYDNDPTQQIELNTEIRPGEVVFEIVDFGRKCDPSSFVPRDLGKLKPGGLGVYFIRKIMDKVEYDVSDSGCTRLRLTMLLQARGDQDAGNG